MFGRVKKNRELEMVLLRLHMNASNNYKDAAQNDYREFLKLFKEYKEKEILKRKQIAYYEEIIIKLEAELKNYTHFDQKPDIKGLDS